MIELTVVPRGQVTKFYRMIPSSTKWCSILFVTFIQLVWANVEKTIFVAPERTLLPDDAAIDNLLLDVLTPAASSKRVFLNATFPDPDHPHGLETWALLEGLHSGQRYELRVCWLATQPTSFWLDTFEVTETFEKPELITSLSTYAYRRHEALSAIEIDKLRATRHKADSETSLLFLRIQAAADYFSTNKTLMEVVPLVHADLILDPYLLNIFPQSLLPTAGFIIVIAISAWFLSGWVERQLLTYIKLGTKNDATKKPQ